MVTIRLRKNGPYVVESDDVQVVDWNGAPYAVERILRAASSQQSTLAE